MEGNKREGSRQRMRNFLGSKVRMENYRNGTCRQNIHKTGGKENTSFKVRIQEVIKHKNGDMNEDVGIQVKK